MRPLYMHSDMVIPNVPSKYHLIRASPSLVSALLWPQLFLEHFSVSLNTKRIDFPWSSIRADCFFVQSMLELVTKFPTKTSQTSTAAPQQRQTQKSTSTFVPPTTTSPCCASESPSTGGKLKGLMANFFLLTVKARSSPARPPAPPFS